MRFCKKCGNKLKEGVKFCSKCGLENNKMENTVREEKKEPNISGEAKLRDESGARVSLEKPKVNVKKEKVQSLDERSQKLKKIEIKKKKSNIKIIGVVLVGVITIGGALGYFLYDDILYKKYKNDIEDISSISEKFVYYDKIAKLEKFDLVKMEIIEILKVDSSNIGYLKRMKNVKDEEKNKVVVDALKSNAVLKYDEGSYSEAKKMLDEASRYGYNLNDTLYINIMVKLNKENISGENGNVDDETTEGLEDMLFQDSSDRYLTEDELRIYSKEELAIARNEIYARHGYVFNQEPFKSYFKEKAWYIQDHSFKGFDSELNDYEVKNIQLLSRLEKER